MEDVLLESPTEPVEMPDRGPLNALAEALSACGITFSFDPDWDVISVGDRAISIWATCSPYAVYGAGDWLPRWQFDSLPALLQFLEEGRCRAA
jgi:hypothetical protein